MNWLYQGLVVNIIWIILVTLFKFPESSLTIDKNIDKIKSCIYNDIIFIILGTILLNFAIFSLAAKQYLSAFFGLYPFAMSLIKFRNDFNKFCSYYLNNKHKCSKKKSK